MTGTTLRMKMEGVPVDQEDVVKSNFEEVILFILFYFFSEKQYSIMLNPLKLHLGM